MAKPLRLALCAVLLAVPSVLAQQPVAPVAGTAPNPVTASTLTGFSTVTITRNIPYTADVTGRYRADLYTPAGTGPFPAIVMIHGGSWRTGHKSELRRLSRDLAAHGYLCFSIDYDTHPRSFPFSWQESRSAILFLRAHADAYHLEPDRIAVLGTSAGGQLAALLAVAANGPATRPHEAPFAAQGDIPVQSAVLFNGGYNLHPKAWLLRRYLGGRCTEIPTVCDDASPDNHVASGAPPIFVGHGTHDRLIPYSQATDFVALLQKAGDPVTPFAATNAGHSYWRSHRWYTRNLNAALDFLHIALTHSTTSPVAPS